MSLRQSQTERLPGKDWNPSTRVPVPAYQSREGESVRSDLGSSDVESSGGDQRPLDNSLQELEHEIALHGQWLEVQKARYASLKRQHESAQGSNHGSSSAGNTPGSEYSYREPTAPPGSLVGGNGGSGQDPNDEPNTKRKDGSSFI